MTAGRMPADDQAIPIEVESRVVVCPANAAQYLRHDGFDSHLWAKVIIDQRYPDPGSNERRRDKAEIALVERPPVAAMDKEKKGCVGARRGKEIERFTGRFSVTQVEPAFEPEARRRTLHLVSRVVLRAFRMALPDVVFGIDRGVDHAIATEMPSFANCLAASLR